MSLLGGDPLTQLAFSMFENKGVYAVLLGSGLSRSANIPTGWEITLDLIRRVALAQGIPEQPDWAAWYRSKFGEEPNYSNLLAEIAESPDERRALLHSYIEPSSSDREAGLRTPTAAHYAIAELVRDGFVRVLVTTNFDRLLETALRERGVEPTIVASIDMLRGAEPLTHSSCFILKLHGDYKDARILNTDEELGAYPPEYNALLDRILDEHGLIISGWSGAWDHALRAALLRAPNRRYPTYWTGRGDLNSDAQELVDHRRAKYVRVGDADSFFSQLRNRVETLRSTRQQSPQSIDLAVSSAKRFAAKPEYRIQLDDLVLDEGNRLFERLALPELESDGELVEGPGKISVSGFRARSESFEAATESLAKVVGILGRWGDGLEFKLIADILQAAYSRTDRAQDGFVATNGLRSYPAVLIFTAYAIGLLRAERWVFLHKLFSLRLGKEYGEPQRAVDALLGYAWKGTQDDVWKRFEGRQNREFAFSDIQFELFTEWSKSFVGLVPDFELLFERFELLAALAFLEREPQAEIEAALASGAGMRRIWVPLGRVAWDRSRRERLVSELKEPELISALCKAGFGGGKAEAFELHLRFIAHTRGW